MYIKLKFVFILSLLLFRLMEKITEKDPVWKQNGTQFVESVTKLLERLLDYRSVMQVINL